MRRLMLALSIASFIATPAVFAHGHHMGSSHARSHREHSRSNDADNQSNAANEGVFDPSDRSRTIADSGRSRHHERVPDEEEVEQPEQ